MSNYSEAVNIAKPSFVMQKQLFEKYLLSTSGVPIRQFTEYFYHQGYEAWRHRVKNEDLDNVKFVEFMCGDLYSNNKANFVALVSLILIEANNVNDILNESERRYYEGESDGNDAKLKSALDHYKTFFEACLRLWATIPYFYAIKRLGVKSEAKKVEEFLRVSAGEKYQCLKARTLYLTKGRLQDLVNVFSNELRNAGGGHDSYEFLDNGDVELHISNPKSGKTRNVVTSFGDIKEKIDAARKAIWVLKNGLMVFINKNSTVLTDVSRSKPLKLREVQHELKRRSEDSRIDLTDFKYDSKKHELMIITRKSRNLNHKSSELLFSSGERYEVVTVANKVKLENQLFGVLQNALSLMSDYVLKDIVLTFVDIDGKHFEVSFSTDAIKNAKRNNGIPAPTSGALPTGEYDINSAVSVPYGTGKETKLMLSLKGYRVI